MNTDQSCVTKNNLRFSENPNNQNGILTVRSNLSRSESSEKCQSSSNTVRLDVSEKLLILEALKFIKGVKNDAMIQQVMDNAEKQFVEALDITFVRHCLRALYERYLDAYSSEVNEEEDIHFYRGKLVMIKDLRSRL